MALRGKEAARRFSTASLNSLVLTLPPVVLWKEGSTVWSPSRTSLKRASLRSVAVSPPRREVFTAFGF